jgi:hypothetical protein
MSSALDRRSRTRVVVTVIAQSVLAVAVLLVLYYLMPTSASIVGQVACALVFLGVV